MLALATLAARMMARARGADGWTAPQRVAPDYRATVARQPSAPRDAAPLIVPHDKPAPRDPVRPADEPALALLAWLAALGWVTFSGQRPRGAPGWDGQSARTWAAVFTSALEVLR